MRNIAVKINERDKSDKHLTFANLKDELVGFLYRETVAKSTRADMQFYILIFFASIGREKKSSLEVILDEAIPKFDALCNSFARRSSMLQRGEYADMVEAHGLRQLFEYDLFFVLATGILNLDDIKRKFADVINSDEIIRSVLSRIEKDYKPRLEKSFEQFVRYRIQDDRTDENGVTHDLSKSVFRPVHMRSSRNLELNMQKSAQIKKVESNSPILLEFLQTVDPQMVFHVWDKFKVALYMKDIVVHGTNLMNSNFVSDGFWLIAGMYLNHRRTNGQNQRKEKQKQKIDLDIAANNDPYLQSLNEKLVEHILNSDKAKDEEIKRLRALRRQEESKPAAGRDIETLKGLHEKIARLSNLEVETKDVSEADHQTRLV